MQSDQSKKQLFELLGKSHRILIALPANPNGDTLGGSLAFASFLRKLGKQVEVYCQKENFGSLSFLPGIDQIKHEIVFPKSFVISVQTSKAKLDELSYNVLKDKINIYLKPQSGNFSEQNVSFSSEFPGYDLIVCIDTPSLESLGALYEKNAELFFQTPKANIDNHINNDNYANVNIIDITVSSTSEMLLDLLKEYEAGLIDEKIATNLLTGIISETNSFQHNKTTPNSFMKASELISFGANQQEIIKNLFKTKELAVLKLLGRAMARIKTLPEFASIFTVVSQQDILKSEADQEVILKVVEDFLANMSDSKIVFFIAEREGYLEMYISSNPNIKLRELVNYFGGEFISDELVKAKIPNRAVTDAEKVITEALNELKPRLGL